MCTSNRLAVHVRADLNGTESAHLELEIRVLNSSTPATNADIDDDQHAEDHTREQQLKNLEDSSGVAPAFSSDESANFSASGKQLTGRGIARQIAGVKRLSNSSSTGNGTSLMPASNYSLATGAAVGNMSSSSDTMTGTDDTLSTTAKMLAGVVGVGGVAAAAKLLLLQLAPCLLPSHAKLQSRYINFTILA